MNKSLLLLFTILLFSSVAGIAQKIEGYWVGILTHSGKQYKFEINIQEGGDYYSRWGCRNCPRLHGEIVDHRDNEKIIDFTGIINRDASINMVDKHFLNREIKEDEIRTKYQFVLEYKNGEPWLVGYWQDYNAKGRKIKQGRIYLKREKPVDAKA